MKDIKRIHLAGVAYEIEIDAGKALESYLQSVKKALGDEELAGDVLHDVELRMGELLGEHDVKPGGVIKLKDVDMLIAQLGEPQAFGDGKTEEAAESTSVQRRLMRDIDHKVFGGVSSGIAAYIGMDAVWIRILFVLLAASGGFGFFLYVVLWLAMPPATSGADKLMMQGKPVTVDAIKTAVGERTPSGSTNVARRTLRIVLGIVGIGFILTAAIILLAITVGLSAVFTRGLDEVVFPQTIHEIIFMTGMFAGAVGVICGLMIAGVASLQAKLSPMSKRTLIAAGIIVAAAAIGVAATSVPASDSYSNRMENAYIVQPVDVPVATVSVETLVVDVPSLTSVRYEISDTLRAEVKTFKGRASNVALQNQNGTLRLTQTEDDKLDGPFHDTTVTIYGPALKKVQVESGAVVYAANRKQDLNIQMQSSESDMRLEGEYGTLNAAVAEDARLIAGDARIAQVALEISSDAEVKFGTIDSLAIKTSEACGERHSGYGTELTYVLRAGGKLTVNGSETTASALEEKYCIMR